MPVHNGTNQIPEGVKAHYYLVSNNYYTQSQAPELTEFTVDKNWQTASESKPYKEPELQTTPKETIIQNIKNIITEIKGDTQ